MSTLVCWNCGQDLKDTPRPISRHATCPQCFNELHCCRLCRHLDPNATLACHEDRADPPLQKDNANFCDFFIPAKNAFNPATKHQSNDARESLDALFADPAPAEKEASNEATGGSSPNQDSPDEISDDQAELSPEAQAKKKLDDLFK